MELKDYLRMLRRGWLTIVAMLTLGLALASLYLVLAPRQFEASTTLFVSASAPATIDDLQQGAEFSAKAVTSYAEVIDSSAVLGPVASEVRPQRDVDYLLEAVTSRAREETTLIDITVSGESPETVTSIANAVGASATQIIPTLETGPGGRPLVRVQQTRPAIEPTLAISPNVRNVLGLGLVVGLCVGIGTTIVRQSLDTRFWRVRDLVEVTDVPLLGVVPPLNHVEQPALPVRDEGDGVVGEAFRTLRTNLGFLASWNHRSLVFTAVADDRDGAQVPANLAWILAQAGRRVVVVDLDLRQSAVGEAIGLGTSAGLADVLLGKADLANVMRDTDNPLLRVVLAGTPQPTPSDLLSTGGLASALRLLEQNHDYVILHAPPVLSFADAAVASSAASGTILSVGAGRTRAEELMNALGALANVGVRPMGLVMTGAGEADRSNTPLSAAPRNPPVTLDSPTLQHQPVGPTRASHRESARRPGPVQPTRRA